MATMIAAQQLDLVTYIASLGPTPVPAATVPDHVRQLLPLRPAHWQRVVSGIPMDETYVYATPLWTGVVVDTIRHRAGSDMLCRDGTVTRYQGDYGRRYRLVLMSLPDAIALNERWPLLPKQSAREHWPLLAFATTDQIDRTDTRVLLQGMARETA
ncbi:hypothetical protein [Novacetimonas hansenii]|uniref:hypothetical protein n=1 Tax=Novacetimonas hansenii TaxID=436 RepID=UPI0039EAC4DD